MTNLVVECNGLSKNFGRIKAVDNLSFSIQKGQIFGILGPNGSGKTTTLGMLSGVTNKSAGSFKWFGQEANDAQRQKLGIILERPNFYPYMSAYKNLKVVAAIKSIKDESRIDEVLKTVGLFERRHDRFKTFSLGMKQRLSIGSALLVNPEVLVLDEPTNGLDPQGIAEIRELILEIAKQGKTIVLASHLLDEVQKVCTDFMVLKKGKLMHLGPVSDVSQGQTKVDIASADLEKLQKVLETSGYTTSVIPTNGLLRVVLNETIDILHLSEHLLKNQVALTHLVEVKQSLEQKFLEILKDHD